MSGRKLNQNINSLFLKVVLILVVFTGTVFFPIPVKAASTIKVTTSSDNTNADSLCSLREAITNANNNALTYPDCLVAGSGNDTIVFASSITSITLGSALPDIADPSGTTINGGNHVTISGNSLYRVFLINAGSSLTLNNTKIVDGRGGVSSNGGSLYVNNSAFSSNQPGISITDGILAITNSSFSGNSANYGAAVDVIGATSKLSISQSDFHDNVTTGGGGGNAVFTDGITKITRSTFRNNLGGGNGSGVIFIDNTSTTTITLSTFSVNSGSMGAIYDSGGILTVANSTFTGNSSPSYGGGIYNFSGNVTLINSTFSGNGAAFGGGDIYQLGSGASLNLRNTILANTTSGGSCMVFLGGAVSGNNNLIEDTVYTCGFTNGVNGNIVGSDPKLGTLSGGLPSIPLLAGSPAINAGDDTVCAAAPVSNTSQNGIPRPQGAHCDMGSTETPVTLAVRSVGTYDGWVLESSESSLVGGSLNSTADTFNLGDDAVNRQYRAILHFNTTGIPDNAIITKVVLKIKKQGLTGTDPYLSLGNILVDIRTGAFGNNVVLQESDYQASADKIGAATILNKPVNDWYTVVFPINVSSYIQKNGFTQIRLRFSTDDNNNSSADYLMFFSGDYASPSFRPILFIDYYVP